MTVWLWAYWPVRNVEREGQQSGERREVVLEGGLRPRAGRTFAITRTDSTVWSSVMITSTFGVAGACFDPAPADPATPAPSTTKSKRASLLTSGNLTNEC